MGLMPMPGKAFVKELERVLERMLTPKKLDPKPKEEWVRYGVP